MRHPICKDFVFLCGDLARAIENVIPSGEYGNHKEAAALLLVVAGDGKMPTDG